MTENKISDRDAARTVLRDVLIHGDPSDQLEAAVALLDSEAQDCDCEPHVTQAAATTLQPLPSWHEASVRDLTWFFLRAVVGAIPAVALTFLLYVLFYFSAIVLTSVVQ